MPRWQEIMVGTVLRVGWLLGALAWTFLALAVVYALLNSL